MELGVFLRPLKRWWWLLLVATLLTGVSSYLVVRQQPALYRATTTLMIGSAFESANPTGNELALSQQLAQTYADLAQRQPVRQQTMTALGLSALPEYNAVPLPNRQLLEISVVDTDPQRAQAVADELAHQLVLQSPTTAKPEEQEREAFVNSQLASLQAHIQQTEAEIAAKQAELESAFGSLEISRIQGDIWSLQTKLNTLQSNYAALLENTKSGAINTIEIIEPARLPSAPTASGGSQMILAASAIALALAVGTAYLLEYLDDSIRTAQDLARVNSFSSLPSIPQFPALDGTVPALSGEESYSFVTDAFRALRTRLFAAIGSQTGQVILITSAAPREGKSFLAANLAAVLAQSRKSVLLIDADLRRPTQHKLFAVSNAFGLTELLHTLEGHSQPLTADEQMKRVIQKIEPMRLGLIAAGAGHDNAAGLLGTDSMKVVLKSVSRHVDYVIIDSPPMLAVADAFVLSTQVDGVIVVTSSGMIPRNQLEQILRRLSDVNANVIGVVLNRQKAGTDGYYHQYYHAYAQQLPQPRRDLPGWAARLQSYLQMQRARLRASNGKSHRQ